MAIVDLLEIGKQGLAANRQGLTTTSNNIANANTPGYSRQRAVLQSNIVAETGGVFIGGGVSVPKVVRVHDVFVDRQITDESRVLGAVKMRSEGLRQMENLLTRTGYEVGESVTNFFNSFRELSVNPENPTLKNTVLESAESLANSFRRVHDSLTDMQTQIDFKLNAMADQINAQVKELGELNDKIGYLETINQSPNELLDRRDTIVRDLSRTLGLPIVSDEKGHANISASGMGMLVQGAQTNLLEVHRSAADGDKREGNADVFVRNGNGALVKVTSSFKEGEFAGLLQVRDEYINGTLKQLDHAAFEFAKSANEIHRQGVAADGTTSRNLFKEQDGAQGYAGAIGVHEDVKGNVSALATGFESAAPGDNRVALAMAEMQTKPLLPSGGIMTDEANPTATISESLNSIAGKLASQTAKEDQMLHHQESIMEQLENYRQSISGVSLEEEAINMMQYQAVFNASAKAMRVGDEMLQTILSLKD